MTKVVCNIICFIFEERRSCILYYEKKERVLYGILFLFSFVGGTQCRQNYVVITHKAINFFFYLHQRVIRENKSFKYPRRSV